MRTQVGIIGAGPAGLLLCEILQRNGVDSVVFERQSRDYVLARIRAGVLEPTTVDVLRENGLATRLDAEGHVHDGARVVWAGREGFLIDVYKYCGKKFVSEDLTFDHVVPRSAGGRTSWDNIVTACVPCNSDKANRTPQQASMTLLRKPAKPRYLPTVTVKMDGRHVPQEWRPYWNVTLDR